MPQLTDLNVPPYYDDFDPAKNYKRVLYKPAVAVQARELNTTQSIFQDQIEKFGDSIYYHGSVVKGGKHFLDQSLYSVRIQNTFSSNVVLNLGYTGTATGYDNTDVITVTSPQNGGDAKFSITTNTTGGDLLITVVDSGYGFNLGSVDANIAISNSTGGASLGTGASFAGVAVSNTVVISNTIISQSADLYAIGRTTNNVNRINIGVLRTATEPNILLYKSTVGSDKPPQFVDSEIIDLYTDFTNANTKIATVQAISSNSFGYGSIFTVDESVYYINGMFVETPLQTAVVNTNVLSTNVVIGYNIQESIVTALEDETLYDNALGYSNYNAPGADRLKVDLVLTAANSDAVTTNTFVAVATIENGLLLTDNRTPLYSVIGDTMARRTFETSGDFTTTQFSLSVKDVGGSTSNVLTGTISGGKAYVKGYEYEFFNPHTINLNKARDVDVVNNGIVDSYYGSYTKITDLQGKLPDINTGMLVELHNTASVGSANVQTKIGLANIRGLDYDSGNGASIVYDTSLFNIQLTGTGGIVNVAYTGTATGYKNTDVIKVVSPAAGGNATVTVTTNATGGALTFNITTAGYGFTEVNATPNVVITNATGGNTTGSGAEFTARAGGGAGGNVSFGDVRSFIVTNANNYANQAFSALIDSSAIVTSKAQLYDVSYDLLVFTLGEKNIATTNNISYTFRRKYPNVSFTSGVGSIYCASVNETFIGEMESTIPAPEVIQLYEVVSTQTSGTFTAGDFIPLDDDTRSVFIPLISEGSISTATIDLGDPTFNGTADVIATIVVSADIRKTKNLQTSKYVATQNIDPNERVSLGYADIYALRAVWDIDDGTFIGPYSNTVTYANTNAVISGNTVYISQINTNLNNDLSNTESWAIANNILTNFTYDNGQRNSFYDHGAVIYNGNVTTGNTVVVFDYFTHSGGKGYFSLESYPVNYDQIPAYTTSTGDVLQLRDCYDFRPRRTDNASTYTFDPFTAPLRDALSYITSDHTYYLSRIDKIILNKDGKFVVKSGIPDYKNPQLPSDLPDGITMFILSYPAYTYKPTDVKIETISHKRYTMQDIGSLDQRLTSVEYYTALTMGEQQLQAGTIAASNGVTLFKNGFLVDAFAGHSVGDVTNLDYKCSIDYTKNHLRPSFFATSIGWDSSAYLSETILQQSLLPPNPIDPITVGPTFVSNNNMMLGFSEKPFITQTYYSEGHHHHCNPFKKRGYHGKLKLKIEKDHWHHHHYLPFCTHNHKDSNNNWLKKPPKDDDDRGCFGSEWGYWHTLIHGIDDSNVKSVEFNKATPLNVTQNKDQTLAALEANYNYLKLTGANNDILAEEYAKIVNYRPSESESFTSKTGNTVVSQFIPPGDPRKETEFVDDGRRFNLSVLPWCRRIEIEFTANGLAPFTRHHMFINGMLVSGHCRHWNYDGNVYFERGRDLITDKHGRLKGEFVIPDALLFKFLAKNYIKVELSDCIRGPRGSTSWARGKVKYKPHDHHHHHGHHHHHEEIEYPMPAPNIFNKDDFDVKEVVFDDPPSGHVHILLEGPSGFTDEDNVTHETQLVTLTDLQRMLKEEYLKFGEDINVLVCDISHIYDIYWIFRRKFKRPPCFGHWIYYLRKYYLNFITMVEIEAELENSQNGYFINSNNMVSNVASSSATTISSVNNLAASFYVDPVNYPNGIYATSVEIAFLDIDFYEPICLHLRPCKDNRPHPHFHHRHSHCWKRPHECIPYIDGDESSYTKFVFDEPVYLEPGQHAYVIETNGTNYRCHGARLGEDDKATKKKISKRPYCGPIYKPNASFWDPDDTFMIKFKLNQANFQPSATVTFPLQQYGNSTFNFNSTSLTTDQVVVPGATAISYKITTTDAASNAYGSSVSILPNITTALTTPKVINQSTANQAILEATLTTTDRNISPVLHINKLSNVFAGNKINSKTDPFLTLYPETLPYNGAALAKYVTKPVTLISSISATSLRVWLDLNLNPGCAVEVYYKILNNYDNTAFSARPWVKMDDPAFQYVNNQTDFIEHAWALDDITYTANDSTYTNFNVFAVKIVMYSDNSSVVPLCQNLRVIAAS